VAPPLDIRLVLPDGAGLARVINCGRPNSRRQAALRETVGNDGIARADETPAQRASSSVSAGEGTKTSDRARDQVFLRVRSTCSASAATIWGSRPSTGRDTCFLNIVRRYRAPCLTSGSQEGSISHDGNGPRGSRPAKRSRRETPGQGHDRNKCTLQAIQPSFRIDWSRPRIGVSVSALRRGRDIRGLVSRRAIWSVRSPVGRR
jgi:hypothetical protein